MTTPPGDMSNAWSEKQKRSAERVLKRYPELRGLPPRMRAEVLDRARRRTSGAGGYVVHIVAFFAIGVLGAGSMAIFMSIVAVLGANLRGSPFAAVATIAGVLCMVLAAIGILAIVRNVDDAQIRKAIRADAASNRFWKCGYELRGLHLVNGVVQCPECGSERTMTEETRGVDAPSRMQ